MRKLRMSELERLDTGTFQKASKLPVVLILDRVRSLHNVGSVFRTADAFRVNEVHLCGLTATPPHPEIDKTALGATSSVTWKSFDRTEESITSLRSEGYSVYALEQTTERIWLDDFQVPDHTKGIAVILGHEVTGVDDHLLSLVDGCIEIPQLGTKHSLNVSVSAGIVMWELFRQLRGRLA